MAQDSPTTTLRTGSSRDGTSGAPSTIDSSVSGAQSVGSWSGHGAHASPGDEMSLKAMRIVDDLGLGTVVPIEISDTTAGQLGLLDEDRLLFLEHPSRLSLSGSSTT